MAQNAKDALLAWSETPAEDRVRMLSEGLQEVAKDADSIAELIVREMGKTKAEATEEMEGATDRKEYLEILLEAQKPKKHGSSVVYRQAIGVVAIMSPWNFPVDEILLLALPALAAGNTVIVKPSEVAPQCGEAAVKAFEKVLPPNVFQVAQGDGAVGAQLVSHPLVNLVAMTGSSATGKKILSSAASSLKRVVLELGGKDPMVVFADSDLDKAAKDAVEYSVFNAGQVCCAFERVYVEESILSEFEAKCAEYAKEYVVGNGMNPGVKVGPMVSAMQRDHVIKQVEDAIKDGAKLLFKGDIPSDAPEGSSFYPITVLSNVTQEMDIARRETFGPVVSLFKFDGSEAEAVRLANDTEYGLGGSVYTGDSEKAKRVASRMFCGQVGINCYPLMEMNIACPWVGFGSSGYGYHSGVEGFQQFSLPKSVVTGS